MLGKLLKYELKATGRYMLPLYALLIIATTVMGLNIRLGGFDGGGIFSLIVTFLFVIACIAVVVIAAVLVLLRFYKNLLGSEGYLMFTLPVTTEQNIASKLLTSMIWVIGGLITGAICGLIFIFLLNGWQAFWKEIGYAWDLLVEKSGMQGLITDILLLALLTLLGMAETITKVYAGLAVGHQWGEHRILGSILAYVGFGVVEMILAAIFRRPVVLIGEKVASVQGVTVYSWIGMNYVNLLLIMGITLLGIAVYGLITWYMLDRHLNLE